MSISDKPNIVFILADQLRACSLPIYGEHQISTPHIDRLASEGVTLTNAVASCPMCTPFRSMMLTGRHPQTTGHVINFLRTRHDEIGIGDAFARAGYQTAWIGKWHLHTASFPELRNVMDYVPQGRDRLGFEYWRGYNFHVNYFNGAVNLDDWRTERWEGYEANALTRYALNFMDHTGSQPFCIFISPHQPHFTPYRFAPEKYYARLPSQISLRENIPESMWGETAQEYRHYLAMILALDDMVGDLLSYLDQTGKAENTLVVFTSDHGSQMGSHGSPPWAKMVPYEESINVPWIMRLPDTLDAGVKRNALMAPVDIFPSLCGMCGIPIPRTIEGYNLSDAWKGIDDAFEQNVVLTMNFSANYDYLEDGQEWRGVRSKKYSYAQWLNGRVELFDLRNDPLQLMNLSGNEDMMHIQEQMEVMLNLIMAKRSDALVECNSYRDWFDNYRRIVSNVYGPLGNPEDEPDWALLS